MKEHIQAQLTNELCEVARRYSTAGCLRIMISQCVDKYLKLDKQWKEDHDQLLGVSVEGKDLA